MAYKSLSTANLPDPAIDPAQGSSPEDYFDIDVYTGTGATHERSNFTFQPDFVWIKNRSQPDEHVLTDAIRGAGYRLESNTPDAESAFASGDLVSFDSDGFTVGGFQRVNANTESFVAWGWKANGSGVSNTDGSITSTVSANTESGFSIVKWTGSGSDGNNTIGHGLNSAPEMIIAKPKDATANWYVWHTGLTSNYYEIYLNLTLGQQGFGQWQNAYPDATKFTVFDGGPLDGSFSGDMIAYCFHSVEGFSKFGSYTGNGLADGTFVYTGFRPAFVMAKQTNATRDWIIKDDQRPTYNPANLSLYPNLPNSEGSGEEIDLLSNGFKIRTTNGKFNASNGTYIYMAFAENPFKYSNAR